VGGEGGDILVGGGGGDILVGCGGGDILVDGGSGDILVDGGGGDILVGGGGGDILVGGGGSGILVGGGGGDILVGGCGDDARICCTAPTFSSMRFIFAIMRSRLDARSSEIVMPPVKSIRLKLLFGTCLTLFRLGVTSSSVLMLGNNWELPELEVPLQPSLLQEGPTMIDSSCEPACWFCSSLNIPAGDLGL
jgi:hypothetical protein